MLHNNKIKQIILEALQADTRVWYFSDGILDVSKPGKPAKPEKSTKPEKHAKFPKPANPVKIKKLNQNLLLDLIEKKRCKYYSFITKKRKLEREIFYKNRT